MREILIVGYSGHAFVVCDIIQSMNNIVVGYLEQSIKKINPFDIPFFGCEKEYINKFEYDFFIAIGDNERRKNAHKLIKEKGFEIINVIHPKSIISSKVILGQGVMVGPNAIINAQSYIKDGVICNSGCIIEHECVVGQFSHIAPGAVLCGNVTVGESTFIGANAVIRPNIKIGNKVTIGAGAVIVKDVGDNIVVVGNPQRIIE